jgi:hypothetical protein
MIGSIDMMFGEVHIIPLFSDMSTFFVDQMDFPIQSIQNPVCVC